MLTRTGHARTRTGPSLQGPGLDLQGQGLDSQGQGAYQVYRPFTFSYLLQVAAKPTIAIKQQQ